MSTSSLLAKVPADWIPGEGVALWHLPRGLAASFAACRATTRHHAKSFYFASFALPRAKREAAYAVYAYCRHIDDCIDEAPPGEAPSAEALLRSTDAILDGSSPLPFAPAFAAVIHHFRIPRALLGDLIEGCCRDRQTPVRIATFAELEEYCYYVASVVGLILCPVFGLRGREALPQAIEMGVAMQLTNILRDVREDFERDRIYLPTGEWEGLDLDLPSLLRDPDRALDSDAYRGYIRFQIERARDYYRRAAAGLPSLANDGSRRTATIMAAVYAGILDEIERHDHDNLSARRYVPFLRKCRIALRALNSRGRWLMANPAWRDKCD